MKFFFSTFLFFLLIASLSSAQTTSDSLQLTERKFSYSIYQGSKQVGPNRLKVLMKDCPFALSRYESGKQTESFGILLVAIGIATTSAALGNYYFNAGTPFPTGVVAAGSLCIGLGFPIFFSGGRTAKSSVLLYNQRCLK